MDLSGFIRKTSEEDFGNGKKFTVSELNLGEIGKLQKYAEQKIIERRSLQVQRVGGDFKERIDYVNQPITTEEKEQYIENNIDALVYAFYLSLKVYQPDIKLETAEELFTSDRVESLSKIMFPDSNGSGEKSDDNKKK